MASAPFQIFLFSLSFLIVGGAQPDWSVAASLLASCCGYALFWRGALFCKTKKGRFFAALVWFGGVSALHLNWFFADRYVGVYIYPVLALLFTGLGLQFAFITLLIRDPRGMGVMQMLALSGGWTLLEWGRLFLFSGFTFDPAGLALSATLPGMQMASAIGVYGLSFWVFFTNLFALRLLYFPSFAHTALWLTTAITPYLFGEAHLLFHERQKREETRTLKALLVQTALIPEAKQQVNGSTPFSPVEQWEKILLLIKPHLQEKPDLIVLPEGSIPYGTLPIYYPQTVRATFQSVFGPVNFPLGERKVSNLFWAKELANLTSADLILGLEAIEQPLAYNAAFFIQPHTNTLMRYEKRILVPMGEYIPFEWCKKILSQYGILDSYSPGKEAKIFPSKKAPIGVSICYEETFGNLMRENKQKGGELLVNLSNDVWYPRSRLPLIHFLHARLRCVEQGVPALRACNTGVTCGIDALGRTVAQLPFETKEREGPALALSLEMPLYHYPTFYALFGDAIVIYFSLIVFAAFVIFNLYKRRQYNLNNLNIYPLRKN